MMTALYWRNKIEPRLWSSGVHSYTTSAAKTVERALVMQRNGADAHHEVQYHREKWEGRQEAWGRRTWVGLAMFQKT